MTLELKNLNFINDFDVFTYDTITLVFNKMSEDILYNAEELSVDMINIECQDSETSTVFPCPNIIGMSNNYIKLYSDYPELEGKQLNSENYTLCKIEVLNA